MSKKIIRYRKTALYEYTVKYMNNGVGGTITIEAENESEAIHTAKFVVDSPLSTFWII